MRPRTVSTTTSALLPHGEHLADLLDDPGEHPELPSVVPPVYTPARRRAVPAARCGAEAPRTCSRNARTARRRVVRAVDRRAGHEAVHAGLGGGLDGVVVDPAVDLDQQREVPGVHQPAGGAHLVQHLGHEPLAAEPGLHAHHQQRVVVPQGLQVGLQRGVRLDRQPGPGAGRAQVAGQRDRVPGRLHVHGHVVRAGLGVADRPAVRVVDHEVAVQRDGRSPPAAPPPPAGRGSGWARSGRPSRRRAASRRPPRAPRRRRGLVGRAGRSRRPGCSGRSSDAR